MCGSHISAHALPLNDELAFYFENDLLFIYLFILENDFKLPFIFILFLNGKQNKKENPKCDSLFGKDSLWETKSGLGGQVTYRKDTIRAVILL